VSPLDYLRAIRLEVARESIDHGASVARAAEKAGFNSTLQLRRAWTRPWGGSPKDGGSHARVR
jgi:methylphosphotriester-DNA--protein-cysteine methyltransferase